MLTHSFLSCYGVVFPLPGVAKLHYSPHEVLRHPQAMPPTSSFPLPITVGTDICQISRVLGLLTSRRGDRFVERILAPEERGSRVAAALLQSYAGDAGSRWKGLRDAKMDVASLKREEPELWKGATFIAGR